MSYYILKVIVSAVLIVLVSEIAKKSALMGAVIASIPIVSLLAFVWLYLETKNVGQIAALSSNIFWLVLPSLILFLLLPKCIEWGLGFWLSLVASVAGTVIFYGVTVWVLQNFRNQTGGF
jgi:hypothetical protein